MQNLNWFRLVVEPFFLTAAFLLIMYEPEEKFKAWWKRQKARRKIKIKKEELV